MITELPPQKQFYVFVPIELPIIGMTCVNVAPTLVEAWELAAHYCPVVYATVVESSSSLIGEVHAREDLLPIACPMPPELERIRVMATELVNGEEPE